MEFKQQYKDAAEQQYEDSEELQSAVEDHELRRGYVAGGQEEEEVGAIFMDEDGVCYEMSHGLLRKVGCLTEEEIPEVVRRRAASTEKRKQKDGAEAE